MAVRQGDSRRRWLAANENELLQFVESKVQGGSSVTEALKEYGKSQGLSWLTARWKYYQLKRSSARPAGGAASSVEKASDGGDFISSLKEIIEASRDAGQDVSAFMKGLARLAALSRETVRLRAELAAQVHKAEEMARQIEETRSGVRNLLGHAERLFMTLESWLALPEVDRVANLMDLADKVREEISVFREERRKLLEASR